MIINEYFHYSYDPIRAELATSRGKRLLFLSIGNLATFGGEIKDEAPTVIEPNTLWVEPIKGLRGHGIGERLVRALVVESKKIGVESINGHIESEYSLDIVKRVFGEQAVKFFHDTPDGTIDEYPEQFAELPISFQQARQSLVRAGSEEYALDHRSFGFDIEVDISKPHIN
ncbi:MAG: hypothetical protein JWO54_606 [Candidatus Saccharibacteria bacterium]|nr:hypothetical protein [Candidatus Saccharibacteria bacterium]MDB5180846.1 hypothetical protein [Candidatus Saccharibacteria bacterium]